MAENMPKDIRIYVSCHKQCKVAENGLLYPVQVGAATAPCRMQDVLHDDEGDNISEKNARYCELTAQYWAWKNQNADYYGFFHYRRYLSFNPVPFKDLQYGEYHISYLNGKALEDIHLNEGEMRALIERYDVIAPDFGYTDERYRNLYSQYRQADVHRIEDLDYVLGLLKGGDREIYSCARKYLSGKEGYFCNMFIMKREIFNEYCAWLFPILFEHERTHDFSAYDSASNRVSGYLAERLCGVYLYYLEHVKKVKIRRLQRVFFEHTERNEIPKPAFGRTDCALCLSADDAYVPYLAALLASVREHSSPEKNYDIIVLTQNISEMNREKLRFLLPSENFSLRFVNVGEYLDGYKGLFVHGHFKVETYFRLYIPELFTGYRKMLYLDCDVIVKADIAELYAENVEGYLLAATRDADHAGQYNGYNPSKKKYVDEILKLKKPFDYFQAGVILFNLDEFRKNYTTEELFRYATSYHWDYLDQDVLNHFAEGHVKFLDMSWNVMNDWGGIRVKDVIARAPYTVSEEYARARRSPRIVHFAGDTKPWEDAELDLSGEFWKYSRLTEFYELTVSRAVRFLSGVKTEQVKKRSAVYRLADALLPAGTRRRAFVKKLIGKY